MPSRYLTQDSVCIYELGQEERYSTLSLANFILRRPWLYDIPLDAIYEIVHRPPNIQREANCNLHGILGGPGSTCTLALLNGQLIHSTLLLFKL
jgi:hypothetical protein